MFLKRKNALFLTWFLESVESIQYKTTVEEERTMALRPTGGIKGVNVSGTDTAVVQTFAYTIEPPPASFIALNERTYSDNGSTIEKF